MRQEGAPHLHLLEMWPLDAREGCLMEMLSILAKIKGTSLASALVFDVFHLPFFELALEMCILLHLVHANF